MIVAVGAASADIWKGERVIFHSAGTFDVLRFWTNLHGTQSAPIAIYTAASGYVLNIDLTDYIRTYPSVTKVRFSDDLDPDNVMETTISVLGLINPESVLIPDHALGSNGALIVPPSKMICDFGVGSPISAEFYANSGTWSASGNASMALNKRSIGQIDGAFTLQDTNSHSRKYTPMAERSCGVDYAFVKWESFTGETRCHLFEVWKRKTETADTYSLLPIDNEYIEIKGRRDGFTIRLDGLCTYDLWYYADVINSSKVEVSFDGSNWDRVQITDKTFTIPDGEAGDGKLEIALNWKRYDAVAM